MSLRRTGSRCLALVVAALTAVSGSVAAVASASETPVMVTAAVPAGGGFTGWDVGLGGPDQVTDPAGMPVRIEVSWWAVQDRPELAFDWSRYDATVERAAAAGMKILLLVTYAPPWASGDHTPQEGLDHWFPTPEWDDEWADFLRRLVQRYGDRAQAFEIWNEPNHASFGNYGNGTDEERKRRYWDLVRLSSRQIRADCPTCVVLAGGSANGTRPPNQQPEPAPNPNSGTAWLEWAYRNGYGDTFDAVAHHPYPSWGQGRPPSQSSCGRPEGSLFGPAYVPGKPWDQQCGTLAALRAVLVAHGHGHRKIWGTEWGYPTHSGNRNHPSLETIRDFDVEGVHLWRELDYVGPLFLYQFRDATHSAGRPCAAKDPDVECHYGIVTRDGTPKEPRFSELVAKVRDVKPSHLTAGQSLRKWSALRSPNQRFFLWMQGDGNLILYDTGTGRVTWSVTGKGARRLLNQADGNLVLFRDADAPVSTWSTGTSTAGPSTLWLQDDGNLVLYRNATGRPVWASNTVAAAA